MLVVGKTGELPFDVLDDGTDVRAPIAGVVAGLRAAAHDVCFFLPVDCPLADGRAVRALGEACRDAAVPPTGPLPAAWAKSALPVLEARLAAGGPLALHRTYEQLDVVTVEVDPASSPTSTRRASSPLLVRRSASRRCSARRAQPLLVGIGSCRAGRTR